MDDAFFNSVEDCLNYFETDPVNGLSTSQYTKLATEYGRNELPPPVRTSWITLIIKQFEDLLVLILLAAAVVSLILGFLEEKSSYFEIFIEPSVILLILIANAIVGVWQESSAEEAIERLKEYEAKHAIVIRNGSIHKIDRGDLVPGDLIRLAVGEKIPADCRLISTSSRTFRTDESMLTGESAAQNKLLAPISRPSNMNIEIVDQDKHNILFSGTLVVHGQSHAMVVLTGVNTSIGRIQDALMTEESNKTPLGQKLDEFAELLSKVILVICIAVWLINIGNFEEHGGFFRGAIYYLKIAVALAVAAIPEGLPAVVTTCLALGTMKMAKKNAIVRSLPSVETLGCTTVICSDKTGTLTTNQMTITHLFTICDVNNDSVRVNEYMVDGTTYDPEGEIKMDGHMVENAAAKHMSLEYISKIGSLCNESSLTYEMSGTGIHWKITGEPTEGSLKVLNEKMRIPEEQIARKIGKQKVIKTFKSVEHYWNSKYEKETTLEFTRDRKSMGVVVQRKISSKKTKDMDDDDEDSVHTRWLFVKGAPETLLTRCTSMYCEQTNEERKLNDNMCKDIHEHIHDYSSNGLRCLAFAYKRLSMDYDVMSVEDYSEIESDMIFVGVVGMLDPPRTEVKDAIRVCNRAGIRVIVITGDNQKTAEAICRSIGLFSDRESLIGKSYLGSEFMSLSDAQQNHAIRKASLYSRVMPWHKLHLVKLLQKQREVVGMTGDGVNDAPALKQADIGIGMGSGTEVARHSSDMILADDNFATIIYAVEEGRAIYANTKQFIRYLISSNIGEVACIFLSAALGLPESLIPVQLLWVNLVTDGLPATALGFNKADCDIMTRPPRGRTEKIINGWMFVRYLLIGLYIGCATVIGFVWWFMYYSGGPGIAYGELSHFHSCGLNTSVGNKYFGEGYDCSIFSDNRPSTIALSILVTIEMFNTFNALSENQSLLTVPPWDNIWVVMAVLLSMVLHCGILYVEFFRGVFATAALNFDEWMIVLVISFPVILLDEVLKFISRGIEERERGRKKKIH